MPEEKVGVITEQGFNFGEYADSEKVTFKEVKDFSKESKEEESEKEKFE